MITNLALRLKQLLPGAPLLIGTVVQSSAYGGTVELIDGSQLTARGEGSVGQKVFVRDGRIEGVAPDLPVFEIEI